LLWRGCVLQCWRDFFGGERICGEEGVFECEGNGLVIGGGGGGFGWTNERVTGAKKEK